MERRLDRRASNIILDPRIDSESWKNDKNCISCNKNFGKAGLSHVLKYFCKFCLRGVCADCSNNRATHETLGPNQRACNICFLIHKPREAKNPEMIYTEKALELKLLEEKLEKINKKISKDQEEDINQLEIQLKILIAEESEIDQQIKIVKESFKDHEKQIANNEKFADEVKLIEMHNCDIEKELAQVNITKEKAHEIQKEIRENEEELARLFKIRQEYIELIKNRTQEEPGEIQVQLEMNKKKNKELEDEIATARQYLMISQEERQTKDKCCSIN